MESGVGKYLRRVILGGIFLLPLTPLIVANSLLFPYITGKAFFFRIIVEIIFALWLILAIRDPNYRPRSSWVLKAVVALVVVLILATLLGFNPYSSFWSNYERMEGLVSYLHLLAYFLVLVSVMKTVKLWAWFLHTSLVVNLLVNFYAVFQWWGIIDPGRGEIRLAATLGNPAYLAVYVLFHIFLLGWLLWLLFKSERWRRETGQRLLGLAYLVLSLLNLFVLYQTQTRGTILGLIGGVFVGELWLIFFAPRAGRERRLALGFIFAVLILVGGFMAVKETSLIKESPALKRFADISLTETTTRSRLTVWQMSLEGFKDRPLLGWGPDNFIAVFAKYYDPSLYDQEPWFDRAHNVFLDWLIATGLLGLLAYLSLFGAVFYYLFKKRRAGPFDSLSQGIIVGLLTAYFIHNLFVFDQLVSLLLFFGLLAYLHTCFISLETEAPPLAVACLRSPWLIITGTIIIIALWGGTLYFINLKPMMTAGEIIQGLKQTEWTERLSLFERALARDTFGSTEAIEQFLPLALRAINSESVLPEVKQRVSNLAVESLNKADRRFSQNARFNSLAGSFYLRLGQVDLAIQYLAKARALAPNKQSVLLELGNAYFKKGMKTEGLAVFQQAYEATPAYDEALKLYALGLFYNNQVEEADQLLTKRFGTVVLEDDRFLNVYAELEYFDRVLILWQKKVEREPENPDYRGSLGMAYFYNGLTKEAIAEFRQAIKLDSAYQPEAERIIRDISAGRNPYPTP